MRVTPELVEQIKTLKGTTTQKAIAEQFGISQGRVSQILLGRGPLTSEARSEAAKKRAASCNVGRKPTLDYVGIREMAENNVEYQEIAEYFGCSVASVSRIVATDPEEGNYDV
jgi:predicted XRE-type DNA-binding protein